MLILTEQTPNPDALKFLVRIPGARGTQSLEPEAATTARSPLAARLFAIPGVRRCLLAEDFLTVQREANGPGWGELKAQVLLALAAHLTSGEPALADRAPEVEAGISDDEIVSEIRQVLGLHIRPGVARDGGDIVFERFDAATGVLWIRMLGACGGCPSSRMTLKARVEQVVKRFVPEVTRVEEEPSSATAAPTLGERLKRMLDELGDAPARAPRTLFTRNGKPRP
ncbi:NifU family protein [Caulobacter sp. RL271]|uniref:NifU family protein n=1 Tax=Caulobacter sp. RL271 TaxID=3458546 RepID=UPI00339D6C6C